MNPFMRRGNGHVKSGNQVTFAVGQRIRIVHSPASYAYNGRVGLITSISGEAISVEVDEHPTDSHCTTFYPEELELEGDV